MLFRTENPVADAEAYYNYLEDNQPKEEEPEFVGYCFGCGDEINSDEDYIYYDGEYFCVDCVEELVEYIVEDSEVVQSDGDWTITNKHFRIGAEVNGRTGDIVYTFSTSLILSGHMEKEYFDTFVSEVEEVSELIKKGVI